MSRLVCAGCGASPSARAWFPFSCPNRGVGDVDHVLVRVLDTKSADLPSASELEECPFVRYRSLLHSAYRASGIRMGDRGFVDLVRRLDRAIEAVDGRGFRTTPLERSAVISEALGFSSTGGVLVKDETGNVAGSHKARHLMGVLLHIEVATEALGDAAAPLRLAVASCGNAALAAATLAAASGRELVVFVPPDAPGAIITRIRSLGAEVRQCPRRQGEHGDPTVAALHRELSGGALPFTCQGDLNGLAIEGGETLAYEIATELHRQGSTVDHIVVQVGGGALASSCAQGFDEAVALGMASKRPRFHTVQTKSAHPLERAHLRLAQELERSPQDLDVLLGHAARHRSRYMWPWESEPKSIASGILDDETYDWLAAARAMLETGGKPVVVGEVQLARAHELGRRAGYHADPTGTAGLAGVADLVSSGEIHPDEKVVVVFTGAETARLALTGS